MLRELLSTETLLLLAKMYHKRKIIFPLATAYLPRKPIYWIQYPEGPPNKLPHIIERLKHNLGYKYGLALGLFSFLASISVMYTLSLSSDHTNSLERERDSIQLSPATYQTCRLISDLSTHSQPVYIDILETGHPLHYFFPFPFSYDSLDAVNRPANTNSGSFQTTCFLGIPPNLFATNLWGDGGGRWLFMEHSF